MRINSENTTPSNHQSSSDHSSKSHTFFNRIKKSIIDWFIGPEEKPLDQATLNHIERLKQAADRVLNQLSQKKNEVQENTPEGRFYQQAFRSIENDVKILKKTIKSDQVDQSSLNVIEKQIEETEHLLKTYEEDENITILAYHIIEGARKSLQKDIAIFESYPKHRLTDIKLDEDEVPITPEIKSAIEEETRIALSKFNELHDYLDELSDELSMEELSNKIQSFHQKRQKFTNITISGIDSTISKFLPQSQKFPKDESKS